MKKSVSTLAITLTAAFAVSSQAVLIQTGSDTNLPNSGQGTETAHVNSIINDPNCIVEFLAKWDVSDSEWEFADDFDGTNFAEPAILGGSASVSWNLTGTGYGVYAVASKQGRFTRVFLENDSSLYVVGSGSITAPPNQGGPGNGDGFSHISFFGKRTPSNQVPDGGSTIALLGLSVLAISRFAKRKNA